MFTRIVVVLNLVASGVASLLLAPIAVLPGWLSASLVAAVTGVLMLLAFKWTSDQAAIRRARNQIKANVLALSLFKDSVVVSLRCQGRVLLGACRLLGLSLMPMLVMAAPMCLLLGQLSLWYQARPLKVGEDAVITVQLAEGPGADLPEVRLEPTSAVAPTIGPVRVPSRHMVCWSIQALKPGYHRLVFQVDGQAYAKELAIGEGFMRISLERPAWRWTAALLHPRERPFSPDAPIRLIQIEYPQRLSWTAGTRTWLLYWLAASMVAALLARPWLNVNI